MNTEKRVLSSIGQVYEKSEGSKFDDDLLKILKEDLSFLSEYFKISDQESFFLSLIIGLNIKSDTVDYEDISKHLGCNPMKILLHNNIFENLVQKGYIDKVRYSGLSYQLSRRFFLRLNPDLIEAIMQDIPIPNVEHIPHLKLIELFEKLYDMNEKRDNDNELTEIMLNKAAHYFESHNDIEIVAHLNQTLSDIADRYIFVYVVWKVLTGNGSTDLGYLINEIFYEKHTAVRKLQSFADGSNALIINDLFELAPSRFGNESDIELTQKARRMLQDAGLKLFQQKKNSIDLIASDSISEKPLIYNREESGHIEMLTQLLAGDKYLEMQQRLNSKNLPAGITVLLHGAPGTGKTETVMQLARQCGRSIFKVDISNTKSVWFGQSEKLIKRIFTDYRQLVSESDSTPILLFNEADAIISKRKNNQTTSVDQTENTIQNIILDELENFEGIFFATTNLINNIDLAFERRFLFKIEFRKPEPGVKQKIWQLKLPFLSEEQCRWLTEQFNFSGAQMENIYRKCEMHEVIQGISVTFDNVIEFCKSELLFDKKEVKIGFCKQ